MPLQVVAISTSDPKAALVNDVADVEKVVPGELDKIRIWFRDYKTPDGKPQNKFGFEDKCLDKRAPWRLPAAPAPAAQEPRPRADAGAAAGRLRWG